MYGYDYAVAIRAALLAVFLTLGLGVVTPVSAETPTELVWATAAATAEENYGWIPSEVLVSERVFDADGVLYERSVVELALSDAGSGGEPKPVWEIVRATVNEEDVTGAAESATAWWADDEHDELAYPFRSEYRSRVRLIAVLPEETIDGYVCDVVEYQVIIDDVKWNGHAYVTREGGIPLRIEISTAESFREDGVFISAFRGTIDYNPVSGRWFPTIFRSTMNVRTRGGALFGFEGSVESVTRYTRYRRNGRNPVEARR